MPWLPWPQVYKLSLQCDLQRVQVWLAESSASAFVFAITLTASPIVAPCTPCPMQLYREVWVHSRLQHPNVVQFYAAFLVGASPQTLRPLPNLPAVS